MIAPSILSANFLRLGEEIKMLNESEADFVHIDVMDGLFVPNITIGFPVISQISKVSLKPLDVHLMIVKPERYIKEFCEAGSKIITVHYEACSHLHRTIEQIKSFGIKAGVSINPHTTVKNLEYIIREVDLVLIMSVNPGFGGQNFIEFTYDKIKELSSMRKQLNLSFLIEVDGGVGLHNAAHLYAYGSDILVAGHSVFSSENPKDTIAKIRNLRQ
jgi:ribulose-phosphate 3-epimerase